MKMTSLLIAVITLLGYGACIGKDACFDCHRVMEGMSLKFTNDIHFANAISCADCHGGDRAETNQNISMNASRGFKVRVTRQGVPGLCGHCHSDTNYMSKYTQGTPADPLAKYKTGIHGKLLEGGRKRAAECVDCHSVHDTRRVDDPLSTASPGRISRTCAKCHASTASAFTGTKHARRFTTAREPGCTACHASHGTETAGTAMLTGPNSVCSRCHRPGSRPLKLAEEMAKVLSGLETAGSKEALARARVAVHGMDLDLLKKAAEPAPGSAAK